MGDQVPVVAIGGSAGSLEVYREVIASLPVGLPGAVIIVLHRSRADIEPLLEIMRSWCPLPVRAAVDDEAPVAGRVEVAPPDVHLVMRDGRLRLVRGPSENGVRPAIDPLLRSLARRPTPRSVGVLLSGALSDGSTGLHLMRRAGHATAVQDPATALMASMPATALQVDARHASLAVEDIAPFIVSRLEEADAGRAGGRPDAGPALDADYDDLPVAGTTPFSCPDCGGVLNRVEDRTTIRFRCKVGHAWHAQELAQSLDEQTENALWVAHRTLQDLLLIDEQLRDRARTEGRLHAVDRLERRIDERRTAAASLWELLSG